MRLEKTVERNRLLIFRCRIPATHGDEQQLAFSVTVILLEGLSITLRVFGLLSRWRRSHDLLPQTTSDQPLSPDSSAAAPGGTKQISMIATYNQSSAGYGLGFPVVTPFGQ